MYTTEQLITLVNHALDELYINEGYLFENNSTERNLVFHFSRYFINIANSKEFYKFYSVDCEYNRNKLDYKRYQSMIYGNESRRMFPDLIFHKRGTNENNILAIEFKKNKLSDENDFCKLKALTNSDCEYKYKLGLYINLTKKRNKETIVKFIDGVKYED